MAPGPAGDDPDRDQRQDQDRRLKGEPGNDEREAERGREAQPPAQGAALLRGQAVALERRGWPPSSSCSRLSSSRAPPGATRASPPRACAPAARGPQRPDRLVRVGAERPAAVGDRPRDRAGSSSRRRSSSSSGIERAPSMCPAANSSGGRTSTRTTSPRRRRSSSSSRPIALDLLAEVAARRALDLGELGGRGVAQGQPDAQRALAGERIAHAVSVALALDQARGVQRLQVLRGVGDRLSAGTRELVDGARAPGRADRAAPGGVGWRAPCPSPRSPRRRRCFVRFGLPYLLFNRLLD